MKVLYSTQSVVEYDGLHYYSSPIQAMYKRYLPLGNEITVFGYLKEVKESHSDPLDEDVLKFKFARKVNSLKSILRGDNKWNDKLAEQLVKDADVCVVHVPCDHSIQVIKYAKKYGKPYMTVVCGCPWDALWNYDWRGKLLAPMAYISLRKVQIDTPYSIYVTSHFLQNRYPTRGKSIGCSNVNISTGIEGVLERRLRQINDCRETKRTLRIGTAAAIDVPYKGQEYVIKALAQLKEEGIRYEYHLIGRGSEERLKNIAIEGDVYDQMFFHGPLPHSKVLDFMDEMDIYVQPSKQEGLPRATIEAMSRGCLCLGSRIAGIPELLEDGFLFEKGNVNEIANILRNISIDTLEEQAKRNFEEAKLYDVNVINKRRERFIQEFKESYIDENI